MIIFCENVLCQVFIDYISIQVNLGKENNTVFLEESAGYYSV